MDVESACFNMVHRQIEPCGVLEPEILSLIHKSQREKFVPSNYQNLAFAEIQIPLGYREVMLSPIMIGRILSALQIRNTENVLEIGTGSGYLTSLVSKLSRSVTSIEIIHPLAIQAINRLSNFKIDNVEIISGNAVEVLKGGKAFDVVILTGSVQELPDSVIKKTNYGGRLFAIVGQEPLMHACIFTRINEEEWSKTILFETNVPQLKEMPNVARFEF